MNTKKVLICLSTIVLTVFLNAQDNQKSNINNIIIEPGRLLSLKSDLACQNLTIFGKLATNGHNLIINGSLEITATGILDSSKDGNLSIRENWKNKGSFLLGKNVVTFSSDGTIENKEIFYDLSISNGHRNCDQNITVLHKLDITKSDANFNADISLIGSSLSISDSSVKFIGNLNFKNTAIDFYLHSGTVVFSKNVNITGNCHLAGGTLSNIGLLLINQNLILNGGTMYGEGDITINGNVLLNSSIGSLAGGSRQITVGGNWEERASVYIPNTATLHFNGTTNILKAKNAFFNLQINGFVLLNSSLEILNHLTITDGCLDVSKNNHQISISGNWNNQVGTKAFNERQGIVVFSNNSILLSDETFYNIKIENNAILDINNKLLSVTGPVFTLQENSRLTNNTINPFNDETANLYYSLTNPGFVSIHVLDLTGNIVNSLYKGKQTAGSYAISWNGKDLSGNIVISGIYFIKIITPEIEEIIKITIQKS